MSHAGGDDTLSRREDDDDVERHTARTTLGESAVSSEIRPVGLRRVDTARSDRIRWGPIWTGAVVAVATYVLLELVLIAIDAMDRDVGGSGGLPDGALWSLLAAAVAFLVGGVVAGASIASKEAGDGVLHGIGVWALSILLFILVAVIGTGLALGTLGHAVNRLEVGDAAEQEASNDDDLKEAAGGAALMLGVTAIAAAVGGLVGTKMWPRDPDPVGFGDEEPRRRVIS